MLIALAVTIALGWTPVDIAEGDPAPPVPPVDAAQGLPYFSVVEAQASGFGEPVRVHGFMVVSDGEARLCQALAKSLPPRCAGDSLRVVGLALSDLPLVTVEGTTWSTEPLDFIGTVSEGVLTVVLRLG
ncbi:MAG: hypothetical protein Q8M79_04350 [Dehalococcoidia bacterium]|nr:hypothetical protein [Dehalococcoidia bacterium]